MKYPHLYNRGLQIDESIYSLGIIFGNKKFKWNKIVKIEVFRKNLKKGRCGDNSILLQGRENLYRKRQKTL